MKKVVLLTNFIPPYRVPLYKALAERLDQFEVLISTPMEPNRPWPPYWEGLSVTVQRCLTLKRKWKHPAGFEEEIFVHIPWDTLLLLFRKRPDVVISAEMGFRTIMAVVYRIIKRESRLLVWATLSDRTEQGRGILRHIVRKWILKHADGVIVNGKAGERYIRTFNYPADRIFHVPYTTELQQFTQHERHPPSEARRRLLYVGQLVPRKGLLQFAKALKQWADQHPTMRIEFWLVGDGPLRKTLSSAAFQGDNLVVKILGNKDYNQLPDIYAKCDILVFPTMADEWGMVVNEAMGAGLPVLGSIYSQAVEELVEDGVTGWTFRPDNEEETSAAIGRAISTSSHDLIKMGQNARERILNLSPVRVAERILSAICAVYEDG